METHIVEAKRYLTNAKEILQQKAGKKEGYYTDAKYVKMAGGTAYKGVLIALDGVFGKKTKGKKDIDWYRQNTMKWNKKLLPVLNSAYNILHLSLGYDGDLNAKVATVGLEEAEKILSVVAKA